MAVIIALHGVAVGTFLFLQGCGTTSSKSTAVEPPPAPMMPPSGGAVTQSPSLQPPVAIEPAAPMTAEPSASQTYIVQKGDSLSKIAARSGVSAREIAELNNIKDANKIRVGQKLLMPSYASTGGSSTETKPAKTAAAKTPETHKAAKTAAPAEAGAGEYIVKSGDSLSKIASRNGTTVKALREANNLKSDSLKVGQKLVLPAGSAKAAAAPSAPAPAPAPAAPSVSAPPAPVDPGAAAAAAAATPAAVPAVSSAPAAGTDVPFEYQMKPGETLDDVARNFAVLKQDILKLNGITDEASVKPGSKIKIPLSAP